MVQISPVILLGALLCIHFDQNNAWTTSPLNHKLNHRKPLQLLAQPPSPYSEDHYEDHMQLNKNVSQQSTSPDVLSSGYCQNFSSTEFTLHSGQSIPLEWEQWHQSATSPRAMLKIIMRQVEQEPTVELLRPALFFASKYSDVRIATRFFRQIDMLNSVNSFDMQLILSCYCNVIRQGSDVYAATLLREWEANGINLPVKAYRTFLWGMHTKTCHIEVAYQAEAMLVRMEKLYADGQTEMRPVMDDYRMVAWIWFKLRPETVFTINRGTNILKKMTTNVVGRDYELFSQKVALDFPFAKALNMYLHCESMPVIQRNKALYDLFMHLLLAFEDGRYNVETPNSKHFSTVLRGWNGYDDLDPEPICLQATQLYGTVKRLVDKGVLHAQKIFSIPVIRSLLKMIYGSNSKENSDTVIELLYILESFALNDEMDRVGVMKSFETAVYYLSANATRQTCMEMYGFLDRRRRDEQGKLCINERMCMRLVIAIRTASWDGCEEEIVNVVGMIEEAQPTPRNVTARAHLYENAMLELRLCQQEGPRDAGHQAHRLLSLVWNKLGNDFNTSKRYIANRYLQIQIKAPEPESLDRAVQLIFMLDDAYQHGCDELRVKNFIWEGILEKMAGIERGHITAMEIFQRMMRRRSNGLTSVMITSAMIDHIMQSLKNSNTTDSIANMESIYKTTQDLKETGNRRVNPCARHVQLIIEAYATIGGIEASRRVVEHYQDVHNRYKQGNVDFKPTPEIARALLGVLLSSDEQALDDATQIFMNIELCDQTADCVFQLAVSLVDKNRSSDAKKLLSRCKDHGFGNPAMIEQLFRDVGSSTKPDVEIARPIERVSNIPDGSTDAIMSVIDILLSSNNVDDLILADSILVSAENSFRANSDSPRPSLQVYDSLINAFSQVGDSEKVAELNARRNSLPAIQDPLHGESIEVDAKEEMLKSTSAEIDEGDGMDDSSDPELFHDDNGEKETAREQLLYLLISVLGTKCTAITAAAFIETFEKITDSRSLEPFTILAMIRLAAFVDDRLLKISHFESAIQAYQEHGSKRAVAYGWSVFQIMDHLSQKGRADLRPTRSSFDIIMTWAHDCAVPSVEKQALLLMEKRLREGRVDLGSMLPFYNRCLSLLAQEGSAREAQSLLTHMIYSPVVDADAISFYHVLSALAKVPNQARAAWNVVELMTDNGLTPDTRCLNQVLKACKISEKCYEVATAVARATHKENISDSHTASLLLDVALQLTDSNERKRLAINVVKMSKKEGLINRSFLEKLLQDKKLTIQTLGDSYVGDPTEVWDRLPRHWTVPS